MTVIICVDNNGGILFNGKRQSKDRIFRKYLLDIVEKKNSRIAMSPYTYSQFKEDERKELTDVKEEFSFDEDYIFLERAIPILWEKVNNLILCCWNRDYPAGQLLHAFDRRELVKD